MTATYPLDPLADAAGIALGVAGGQLSDGAPGGIAELAHRLGTSPSTVKRRRVTGLDVFEADAWAGRLGLLPSEVWGERWWTDYDGAFLRGAAAINAAKETCPQGHPYDAVDGAGDRRCRTCHRRQVAAWRARKYGIFPYSQVVAPVTATQPSLFDVEAA